MPWLQVRILLGPFMKCLSALQISTCLTDALPLKRCNQDSPGKLARMSRSRELPLAAILERAKVQNLITNRDILTHGD